MSGHRDILLGSPAWDIFLWGISNI